MAQIEIREMKNDGSLTGLFDPFLKLIAQLETKRDQCQQELSELYIKLRTSPEEVKNWQKTSKENMIQFYNDLIDKYLGMMDRFFARAKRMKRRLNKARSTAERVAILEREADTLIEFKESLMSEEGLWLTFKIYVAYFESTYMFYLRTLELEQHSTNENASEDCQYPHTREQTKAYNRVAKMYNHQLFWSGSLTDFVYVMDTLAVNGYLRANDLEENLAATFDHKPKGKDKAQKTTANKINNRRRNMKLGHNTASPEIKRTVNTILQNLTPEKEAELSTNSEKTEKKG